VTNCILYYNKAAFNGDNCYSGALRYCCTTPLPSGPGNITNAPLFVGTNVWSDFRLQTGSPCINSGKNIVAVGPTDLDGNPRIVGGTVDMGAYEFQSPATTVSQAWLQQYGMPTDGTADFMDPDGDLLNNWQEWIAGTNPTNAASTLRMVSATNTISGILVSWTGVTNHNYTLERSTNLTSGSFTVVQGNIPGRDGTLTITNTTATGPGPFFYRVRVDR
jgi:hypothetical protein